MKIWQLQKKIDEQWVALCNRGSNEFEMTLHTRVVPQGHRNFQSTTLEGEAYERLASRPRACEE